MLFLFQLTFSILNMFPWFTTQKLPCTYRWIDLIFTTTNLPLSLSEASKASQSKPIRFAAVGTLLGVTLRKHQGFFLQIYETVHQQFGSTDQPWKSHHPTTHDFFLRSELGHRAKRSKTNLSFFLVVESFPFSKKAGFFIPCPKIFWSTILK